MKGKIQLDELGGNVGRHGVMEDDGNSSLTKYHHLQIGLGAGATEFIIFVLRQLAPIPSTRRIVAWNLLQYYCRNIRLPLAV